MLKFIDLTPWLFILTILISEELVEGKKNPNVVNKAIIKTIKVENDEIVDCYYIHRQPSLNHPLLHNHKIQMRPSSYPKGMKSYNLGTLELTQTWHKYGSCPEGTIPIRRKEKNYNPTLLHKHDDPMFLPYKTLNTSQANANGGGHEVAMIVVEGNFLGAQAKMNLWKPVTETNESSVSQIRLVAGDLRDIYTLNTIEVGWEVNQNIYGDDQTRFFIYKKMDGYSSGCRNLRCKGFVQISPDVALGCTFTELSTFGGDQKDATFSIYKDQSSGHWWIHVQGIPIGYYPNSLFSELSKKATIAEWGGEITNLKNKGQHTSTQMGSGHFPSEGGLKTSSYFNWVQIVDENNVSKDPENVEKRVTNRDCYDLNIDDDHHDTNGYSFYYGGPGYNDKCQ